MDEVKEKLERVYELMTPEILAELSEEELSSLRELLKKINHAMLEEAGE